MPGLPGRQADPVTDPSAPQLAIDSPKAPLMGLSRVSLATVAQLQADVVQFGPLNFDSVMGHQSGEPGSPYCEIAQYQGLLPVMPW